jgi:succinate dehydrogenase flavin-adding protein (antitoxin of CptAB toxin-antitoxin module)
MFGIGSRRPVDTPPRFELARRSKLYYQSWRGVESIIASTFYRLSLAKAPTRK